MNKNKSEIPIIIIIRVLISTFFDNFNNLNIGKKIKRNKRTTSTTTKVQNKTALAIGCNQKKIFNTEREKKIQQSATYEEY